MDNRSGSVGMGSRSRLAVMSNRRFASSIGT